MKTNLVYFDETGDDGLIKTSSETFILTSIYMKSEDWQKNYNQMKFLRKQLKDKYGFHVKEEMHTELLKETSSIREEISKVKEETKVLFNALVEEMGNMEDRVNKRFEKVDDTLEKMQHEINACKLDRDTVSLLVRKTNELDKRVEILEIKTA